MVTLEQLKNAYALAVTNNWTNEELANHLKMKENSLTQRLTGIRKDLKLAGQDDETIRTLLPQLKRKPSTKPSPRKQFLSEWASSVPARTQTGENSEAPPEGSETSETQTV